MIPVRVLTAADVGVTAAMLFRAFEDDPISGAIFPAGRHREKGLQSFFSIQMRVTYLEPGTSWVAEDGSGAALWLPPGHISGGLRTLLRLAPVIGHVGRNLPRTLRLLAAIDSEHPKTPHWYLGVLGTDPPAQGKGHGSALMAPALAHADATGLPAYLESSKERNLAFYARFGFEVMKELKVPGMPPVWPMWREPRS
ncbi:MAG TPA: GNAT family N-acetyltransferase [Acidimicrobiales bacterium]|nr:GNAT family N-acetyltransferase [Acidimicrobiales bacterium]